MLSLLRALRSVLDFGVIEEASENLTNERFPLWVSKVSYRDPVKGSLARSTITHTLELRERLIEAFSDAPAIVKCATNIIDTTVVISIELEDGAALQWSFRGSYFEDLTIFTPCCHSYCTSRNDQTICTQCFTPIEGGEALKIEDSQTLAARIEQGLKAAGCDPLKSVIVAQEVEQVYTLFEETPYPATVVDMLASSRL